MSREHSSRLYLCFQKRNVLIDGCATEAEHTRKLANIEMVAFVCRVVPKEDCRDALNRNLLPPNPLPLGPGVRHSRPHPHSYPRHPQLTEHPGYLQERPTHRVRLAVKAQY